MASHVDIDNDKVRVTRWTLAQGDETGQHRHEHDYVVIPLRSGRMRITQPDGSEVTTELTQAVPYFRQAGATHNVSNADPDVVDFVEVELLG